MAEEIRQKDLRENGEPLQRRRIIAKMESKSGPRLNVGKAQGQHFGRMKAAIPKSLPGEL